MNISRGIYLAMSAIASLAILIIPAAAQSSPNHSGVTVFVAASAVPGDDTERLASAFAEAIAAGPGSRVKLSEGQFYTSSLVIEGFEGVFEGAGRAVYDEVGTLVSGTSVDVLRGLDPDADPVSFFIPENGILSFLLRFDGGDVEISDMTFHITAPTPSDSDSFFPFPGAGGVGQIFDGNLDVILYLEGDEDDPLQATVDGVDFIGESSGMRGFNFGFPEWGFLDGRNVFTAVWVGGPVTDWYGKVDEEGIIQVEAPKRWTRGDVDLRVVDSGFHRIGDTGLFVAGLADNEVVVRDNVLTEVPFGMILESMVDCSAELATNAISISPTYAGRGVAVWQIESPRNPDVPASDPPEPIEGASDFSVYGNHIEGLSGPFGLGLGLHLLDHSRGSFGMPSLSATVVDNSMSGDVEVFLFNEDITDSLFAFNSMTGDAAVFVNNQNVTDSLFAFNHIAGTGFIGLVLADSHDNVVFRNTFEVTREGFEADVILQGVFPDRSCDEDFLSSGNTVIGSPTEPPSLIDNSDAPSTEVYDGLNKLKFVDIRESDCGS